MSFTPTFDLIVIGAGMGGVLAANKCASQGWSVAIVDALPYGGTCALRGCDPKKILRRGAEIIDAAHLMAGKGIDANGLKLNWSALMKHKQGFTDPVPDRMEGGLKKNGVVTLHGKAQFTGSDSLQIDGKNYQARHFLVATGSRPRPMDIPGADLMIDSTEFLNLEVLPPRLLFVGGGFISFEFAHISARAGSQATIMDRGKTPLRGFDPDLVDMLIRRSSEVGIEVKRETEIVAISRTENGIEVTIESSGTQSIIETDLVVHGAGRVPEIGDLDLEKAGIAFGKNGVTVASHLQSISNENVYAAGDAADTKGMSLTPVAVIEGKVAATNMLKGKQITPDYSGIPTTVFTVPELARVGLLEEEARALNIDFSVRFNNTGTWFSNYRIGESSAAAKILIDNSSDKIVGAHLFGPEYGELINFFGLAIKLGLTSKQLRSMTAAYPSVGSDLGSLV